MTSRFMSISGGFFAGRTYLGKISLRHREYYFSISQQMMMFLAFIVAPAVVQRGTAYYLGEGGGLSYSSPLLLLLLLPRCTFSLLHIAPSRIINNAAGEPIIHHLL